MGDLKLSARRSFVGLVTCKQKSAPSNSLFGWDASSITKRQEQEARALPFAVFAGRARGVEGGVDDEMGW